MKIENGKIVGVTEQELFDFYLKRELDDIYSFDEYLRRMKAAGVNVIQEVIADEN